MAGELIAGEGVDALSLRKLAADAGTSTTAVYSLFGGKPGLVRTVYLEAFRRFGARLAAAGGHTDPAENVVQLGLAYRDNALAEPHLYELLFTKTVSEYVSKQDDDEIKAIASATFQTLVDAVREAVKAGVFVNEPAEFIATAAWGLVHGLISLELNGNLPPDAVIAPVYERALRASVDGWRRT